MSAPAYVRALELKLNTVHRDIKTLMSLIENKETFKTNPKAPNRPQPKLGLNGKPLLAKPQKKKLPPVKPKPITKAKTPTPDILDFTLTEVNTERTLALKGLKPEELDVKFWYAYKDGKTFLSTDGIEMDIKEGVIKVYSDSEMTTFKKKPGNPFQLHKDSIEVKFKNASNKHLTLRFRVPKQAAALVRMDTDRILNHANDKLSFTRYPEADTFEFNKGWKNQ